MDRADAEWYRQFLMGEFEKIGINANSDLSRERTRSNFALTDSMNNQVTKEAISYLIELYKDRETLEEAIERARQRDSRVKDLQKGLFSSIGEWAGRLATGAIGTAIGWYLFSGKH
jgi:hypothetical protein